MDTSFTFPYPATDVAVPHVQKLVGMLLGKVPATLDEACHSGWIAQGYVQSLVVGLPPSSSAATVTELSDADAVAVLEKLADYDPSAPAAQGILDSIGGRMALTLLLPILQKWLIAFLQDGGLQKIIDKVTAPPAA